MDEMLVELNKRFPRCDYAQIRKYEPAMWTSREYNSKFENKAPMTQWKTTPLDYEQAAALFNYLVSDNIKHVVLGRGSNVVISDDGYDGVAVLLTDLNKIVVDGNVIAAGAGALMFNLACAAEQSGLEGIEFAHGIPGSVGGGVYMNAGAYGGEMCQVITACECFDKKSGKIVKRPPLWRRIKTSAPHTMP